MHGDISSQKPSWATGARLLAAGLLGVAVAIVLVSCGSSGRGLIPIANAGPLQSDFEAVAQAARAGGGDCTATTEAINKTEQDFAALPATIDPGLHRRLSEGISNLRERALALCAQPLVQTATTTTPSRTTTTTTTTTTPTTTSTTTPTTRTSTTPTTPTQTTPPNNGGGTVAPGGEAQPGGGAGVGESGGAGVQEGGK
ncbi:MAG TPA: hypothetical protein VG053_03380 [Solirubrobacteraceae bacterium]|jgi:hypothetical protein|nr:hypothetical protein [Solirubrobacteraceae bacterium]